MLRRALDLPRQLLAALRGPTLLRSCFAIVIVFLSTACIPSNAETQKITPYRVGQHDLYVPDAYVRFAWTSVGVGGPSGLLQAYFPGSAPVLEEPKDLVQRGLWHKNIRILFSNAVSNPDFDPEKGLAAVARLFKADKVMGERYGLTHQTQSDEAKSYWDDLWVERDDEELLSYVNCSKNYADEVVPHCEHHFWDERFVYKVTYDKRLLPEWRLIRENVVALMASFRSEESARVFLADQISKTLPIQTGESP